MFEPTTETERYFWAEATPFLPGETIEACAYLAPHRRRRSGILSFVETWRARCTFVAISATKVVMIATRIPIRSPLLENKGLTFLDRTEIVGAGVVERTGKGVLLLQLASGGFVAYDVDREVRYVSVQRELFDRVTAWWPRTAEIQAAGGDAKVPRAVVRPKR